MSGESTVRPRPTAIARFHAGLALVPYERLLPDDARRAMVGLLRRILDDNAYGQRLTARFVAPTMVQRIRHKDLGDIKKVYFWLARASPRWWAVEQYVFGDREAENGRSMFVLPIASIKAMAEVVVYHRNDKVNPRASDEALREAIEDLCDEATTAMFIGLMEGRRLPRARFLLRVAMAQLSPAQRGAIEALQASGWDLFPAAESLGMSEDSLTERYFRAIVDLTAALRDALVADARARGEEPLL
jgi:hypothetical protein